LFFVKMTAIHGVGGFRTHFALVHDGFARSDSRPRLIAWPAHL
jgi:hypothetical protein